MLCFKTTTTAGTTTTTAAATTTKTTTNQIANVHTHTDGRAHEKLSFLLRLISLFSLRVLCLI